MEKENNMENLNIKISGHEIYKAVRNYLINEHQITKDYVKTEIEKIVSKEVEKYVKQMLDTKEFSRNIRAAIGDYMSKGVPGRQIYSDNTAFNVWLESEVKKIIKEDVLSKYKISIGENNGQ